MGKIHLIRHGITEANEKHIYCGKTDLPLSEKGKRGLRQLKDSGIYPAADLFFSSGLIRTNQTMDFIYGTVDRKHIKELAEYDFGLFEMKSYDELKERTDYQAWITDKTEQVQCPFGESKVQFQERVISGYLQILECTKNTDCSAMVVCHGGTIACIMEYISPGEKNFYEWQPKPGRGYTIAYVGERLHIDLIESKIL